MKTKDYIFALAVFIFLMITMAAIYEYLPLDDEFYYRKDLKAASEVWDRK